MKSPIKERSFLETCRFFLPLFIGFMGKFFFSLGFKANPINKSETMSTAEIMNAKTNERETSEKIEFKRAIN